MSFFRIRAENQLFFLGTGQVLGIQDIGINNNFGNFPLKYIGIGNKGLNQTSNGQQYTDLSLNSSFISEDIIFQQTGSQPINCFILKTQDNLNNAYSLISGYLTNYSAKYIPNQVPQINSTFRFYQNAGYIGTGIIDSGAYYQLTGIQQNIYRDFNNEVADSNRINLSINEAEINRVQSFDFGISINKLPIYNIRSRFPSRIDSIYPVNVTASLSFEADSLYSGIVLTDFPQTKIIQNIKLNVFSNRTNILMENYFLQNMTLVSENSSINIDGNLIITRNYLGQLFNQTDYFDYVSIPLWDFGYVYQSPSVYLDWGNVNTAYISGYDFGTVDGVFD
jgi:hypothetical protein